jgi:hypothetical protein
VVELHISLMTQLYMAVVAVYLITLVVDMVVMAAVKVVV